MEIPENKFVRLKKFFMFDVPVRKQLSILLTKITSFQNVILNLHNEKERVHNCVDFRRKRTANSLTHLYKC